MYTRKERINLHFYLINKHFLATYPLTSCSSYLHSISWLTPECVSLMELRWQMYDIWTLADIMLHYEDVA